MLGAQAPILGRRDETRRAASLPNREPAVTRAAGAAVLVDFRSEAVADRSGSDGLAAGPA